MIKKDVKLYNMILPPFMLMTFVPWLSALSLAGNFLIDSLVVLGISLCVYKRFDKTFYKQSILKVWLLGFAADFAGVLHLIIVGAGARYRSQGNVIDAISTGIHYAFNGSRTYYNIWSVLYIVSGIVAAAVAIFLLDYFISFRKTGLTKKQRLLSALSLAVITAPYTFLLPDTLFY